jgi:hypothetical protein
MARSAFPFVIAVWIAAFPASPVRLRSEEARPAPAPEHQGKLEAKLEDGLVRVEVDGRLFTCYKFARTQKLPYFFPVSGPRSGKSVTTETSEPYPHHHSLFFGCDRVSGGNYWQEGNERGQIVSEGPRIVEAKGDRVVIEDRCRWQRPGAPDPFLDKRRMAISAPSRDLRLIELTIELEAQSDVRIERSNHALFSGRMAPELSALKGGRLVNAEGGLAHAGTFGKRSAWCDCSGTRDGVREGMAILDGPQNRWYPTTWFTRDYGFFSPSPMNWLDADGVRFAKGETLVLKYLVVVHAGDEKEADIAGLFRRWEKGDFGPAGDKK